MATTDPALRKKLLEKLGVTPQALSQRVKKRKKELPMSTPHAAYTIAHDEGMDISKYLSPEETAEVRGLISALQHNGLPAAAKAPKTAARKSRSGPAQVKVTIAGVDIGKIPALSHAHAADVKRMSERVYPLLYIFENSVRDLIERVLKDAHGSDWWTKAVPRTVQNTATKHKAAEAKEPWHGARSKRDIDYVFLNDLWSIIKDKWQHFKRFFPNQSWVEALITGDMNVSRRVFAHMNPLAENDVRNIEAAFRKWTNQVKGKEGELP
jgi:transcriptional regulator with XRE-family HTH domain